MTMVFTRILCEAVCLYDIFTKKYQKATSSAILSKKGNINRDIKWEVRKNPGYISKEHRPHWCRKYNKSRLQQFYCLGQARGRKCPFLLSSDSHKTEYSYMEQGLRVLDRQLEKKFGKGFDYDKALPISRKEKIRCNSILRKMREKNES